MLRLKISNNEKLKSRLSEKSWEQKIFHYNPNKISEIKKNICRNYIYFEISGLWRRVFEIFAILGIIHSAFFGILKSRSPIFRSNRDSWTSHNKPESGLWVFIF